MHERSLTALVENITMTSFQTLIATDINVLCVNNSQTDLRISLNVTMFCAVAIDGKAFNSLTTRRLQSPAYIFAVNLHRVTFKMQFYVIYERGKD